MIFLLFFLNFSWFTTAEIPPEGITEKKYFSRRDLSGNWLYKSSETGELIPGSPGVKTNFICQWLPLSEYEGNRIAFMANKGLCLFIDNRLVWTAHKTDSFSLRIGNEIPKPLRSIFKENLFLFWHPEGLVPIQPVHLLFSEINTSPGSVILHPPLQFLNFKYYFFFILLIIVSGVMVLHINYPGHIHKNLQVLMGDSRSREFDKTPGAFFTTYHLIFAGIFLLTIASHFLLFENYFHFQLPFSLSLKNPVNKTGFYTLLIFAAYFLKFIFYRICGYVFQQSRTINHMFGLVLQWDFFLSLFLFLWLLVYVSLPAIYYTKSVITEIIVVLLFLIFRYFRVYKHLESEKSFYKLHLFLYLCALEIIPLCIGLRVLILPT